MKLSKEMLWKGKKALYHAIEAYPISSFYAVALALWSLSGPAGQEKANSLVPVKHTSKKKKK